MSIRSRQRGEGHGVDAHDGGGAMRWLLTYADMITLLMAFFIMLYSMSILNLSRFHQVAVSIRSGFGGILQGQSRHILSTSGQMSVRPSAIEGDTAGVPYSLIKQINAFVKERKLGGSVRMYTDQRGLVVSLLSDRVLFQTGRAEIRPESRPVLQKIASVLNAVPNDVRVEGHTCNLPTRSRQYPSNWELSTARATNVVRFLIGSGGVPAARLSAAGYADTHPYAPNTTEANRLLNRRVEIVVIRAAFQEPQAGPAIAAASRG